MFDRRGKRFVKIVGVAVVMAVLLAVWLPGCGDDGDEGKQGVLVFGTGMSAGEGLNPNMIQFSFATANAVYEKLVTYDNAKAEYVPTLATSWDVSEDGLTWTFHLREGVKFQDGSDLNADCFKYSYDVMLNGPQAYKFTAVESMEVVDPMTVRFQLSYSYPLIYAISHAPFVVSTTAVDKLGDQAYEPGNRAGTGPYMVKAVNTTVETTLERNPTYWGGWEGDHANAPDILVIRMIQEAAPRVQNLTQNVVQLMHPVPETDVKTLQGNDKVQVHIQDTATCSVMHFNVNMEPTDDVNFRQALYYAVPFQDIVDIAHSGFAIPCSGFIGPNHYGYDKQLAEIGMHAQDLDKAREYLAKTKYPDGDVTINCIVDNAQAAGTRSMELYKTALAELGITLEVQPLDINVIFEEGMSGPKHNIICISKPGLADGVGTLEMDLQSQSLYNFTGWTDPRIDEIVAEAFGVMTKEPDKAVDLLLEADHILMDNMPEVQLAYAQSLSAASVDINYTGMIDQQFMLPDYYNLWFKK